MIRAAATDDTNIIFGATIDDRLTGQLWITVIATGLGGPRRRAASQRAGSRATATRSTRRRSCATRHAGRTARLSAMKGAVAGGHPLTAQAGARALAEGGNAVDACVAAAFAAAVTESSAHGPGAGGFMLVHRARDRSTRLADFFVAAPGLGLKRHRARRDAGRSTSASATSRRRPSRS